MTVHSRRVLVVRIHCTYLYCRNDGSTCSAVFASCSVLPSRVYLFEASLSSRDGQDLLWSILTAKVWPEFFLSGPARSRREHLEHNVVAAFFPIQIVFALQCLSLRLDRWLVSEDEVCVQCNIVLVSTPPFQTLQY